MDILLDCIRDRVRTLLAGVTIRVAITGSEFVLDALDLAYAQRVVEAIQAKSVK